jgi:hypothetical protein
MPVSVRTWLVRLLAGATLAVAAIALPAATAAAAPKQGKLYEVIVAPAYAGQTLSDPGAPPLQTAGDYTVTIENKTGTQSLGSVNLTIPDAITVVGDRSVDRGVVLPAGSNPRLVELRDLNLANNEKVTVKLGLRMPCTPAADWRVDARQSNDFSGTPGNVLGPLTAASVINTSLAATCSLRFVDADPSTGTLSGQPAGTEIDQPVRAVAFTPSSSQLVTVEAVDGSPAQARLTWFGQAIAVTSDPGGYSTSSTASAGLATFSGLVIPASGNYTLAATTAAPGVATGESDPFQVIGVVEDCAPSACSAHLNGAKSNVTLSGSPTEGSGFALLSLNLGADPIGASGCAGYVPPSGEYYEFQLSGVAGAKTIAVEYTKLAMKNRSLSSLEICFAVPGPDGFVAKSGSPAPGFDYDGDPATGTGGNEGFAGLLPNCPQTPVAPCIMSRTGTAGGGAIITAFAPASLGDPRLH